MSTMSSTFWCYNCNRFVRVWTQDSSINCPDCTAGFVEQVDTPTQSSLSESRRRRFPAAAMYMVPGSAPGPGSSPRLRRNRGNGSDRSPFNPVIVLRGGPNEGVPAGGGFELHYDDGSGSGLRPLPASMSEFLLRSGFDRLLDQLSRIEVNGIGAIDSNPPASKSSIESMPAVEIIEHHIDIESHCAVCKEPFELGVEAREMPCKHLYHHDCILPWLSLRNSCPVCRRELPSMDSENGGDCEVGGDEAVGLRIWRLRGGVFAVGRFSGGRRGGEREFPVVYTEMDGGFSGGGSNERRSGLRRVLNGWFACFGRGGSSSSTSRQSRESGFEVNDGV